MVDAAELITAFSEYLLEFLPSAFSGARPSYQLLHID
jgi:hypothetical protein